MPVTVAAVGENTPGERRSAITPEIVKKLRAAGVRVVLPPGYGASTWYTAADFGDVEWHDDAISEADVVLCVRPPDEAALRRMKPGTLLIGMLQPHGGDTGIRAMADGKLGSFSLELLPRTTRAQAMDVLSSQAGMAGYKSVLIGAELCDKFFPMLTTAAGTVRPSRVLVIGAGVAGLQAIATAKRLGAQVEGFDVRPETREQIESLGAKFLDLGVSAAGEGGYLRELTSEERAEQQRRLGEQLKRMDVVVCTAAVPGRAAPRIITAGMVEGMKAGSVVVDMAAETGGNCELTEPGSTVEKHGVRIAGPLNLPSSGAIHASEMYARNLFNFLSLMLDDSGELKLDWDDELVAKSCLTFDGEIRHEPTRNRLNGAS